jgi:hypothetical protein
MTRACSNGRLALFLGPQAAAWRLGARRRVSVPWGGGSCSAATVRGVARVSISKNLQLGRSFYRLVDHRGAGDPPPTNFEPNTR